MGDELRRGDRVEWNFGRGKAVGVVKRKLTAPTSVGGQKVAASPDDPRYLEDRQVRQGGGQEGERPAQDRPEALTGAHR